MNYKNLTSDMALQIAHDIRSPLSALMAVMSSPGPFDESKRSLALKATKRVQEIAEQLLTHCNLIYQENDSEIGVALIIENIIEEKRLILPREIRIQTHFRGNVFKKISLAQARELKRILSNIINNSVEAIYKKSHDGVINIAMMGWAEGVEISVEDNGCGIPNEILQKLGRKGFSWQKRNGHGLGLSRAKELILQWGGIFELTSEVGNGTKVKMVF